MVLFGGVNSAFAVGAASFTADTTVLNSPVTLTIVGGSDADSVVTTGGTTIVVTISSGSTFTLTSADHYRLDNDGGFGTSCDGNQSKLVITTAGSGVVVTVTPNTNIILCSSGGGVSSSGGGGGGGGSVSTPTPTPSVTATPTPAVTSTPVPTPTPYVIQNYNTANSNAAPIAKFITNIAPGARGATVSALQRRLKELGYLPANHVVTTLFGPVTRAAVIKLQKANHLAQVGNVGPATRAILNRQ